MDRTKLLLNHKKLAFLLKRHHVSFIYIISASLSTSRRKVVATFKNLDVLKILELVDQINKTPKETKKARSSFFAYYF